MNIGDEVRRRVAEIDAELPALEAQLEEIAPKIKLLRAEHRNLNRVLRNLDGNPGPAVTDEQILKAVKKLGGEDICGMAVAQSLGVTLRNVARKLRKLVDDGVLTGDPEKGYTVVK